MKHDVQEALDEILDMAPMFRREVIISYLRRNLPEEEARKLYFKKDRKSYMNKMVRGGYLRQDELLEEYCQSVIEAADMFRNRDLAARHGPPPKFRN